MLLLTHTNLRQVPAIRLSRTDTRATLNDLLASGESPHRLFNLFHLDPRNYEYLARYVEIFNAYPACHTKILGTVSAIRAPIAYDRVKTALAKLEAASDSYLPRPSRKGLIESIRVPARIVSAYQSEGERARPCDTVRSPLSRPDEAADANLATGPATGCDLNLPVLPRLAGRTGLSSDIRSWPAGTPTFAQAHARALPETRQNIEESLNNATAGNLASLHSRRPRIFQVYAPDPLSGDRIQHPVQQYAVRFPNGAIISTDSSDAYSLLEQVSHAMHRNETFDSIGKQILLERIGWQFNAIAGGYEAYHIEHATRYAETLHRLIGTLFDNTLRN